MKKLFLAALAGTAMLGLAACGSKDDNATSTDTTLATTDTYATPAATTRLMNSSTLPRVLMTGVSSREARGSIVPDGGDELSGETPSGPTQ